MNKEEIIARPYEEYYEMIKDMSKDNMIQGLYDLSKNCIEYQNYINQLEEENKQLKINRDESIEILKLCNSQCSKETISILERGKE